MCVFLKDLRNECALPGQTFMEKDGFVKGMWRIDEELNRVQMMRSSTATVRSPQARSIQSTTENTINLLN